MKSISFARRGFTLLEMLLVLTIIVALFAILAPVINTYRHKTNLKTADARIKTFEEALEHYFVDNGSYPTTEQGLNALIYIPLNEMGQGMQQGGMTMTMQPGQMSTDPNALAMGQGGAAAVGPDMLTQPGGMQQPGMMQPGGMQQPGMMQPGGMQQPGMMQPGGMQQPGMMQPGGMQQPGGMTGITQPSMDPSMGGMQQPGMGMGMDPTMSGMQSGMMGTTIQPFFNPQLYINARKRPQPYFSASTLPKDPWGQDFRYEYTLLNGVNPKTGDNKPAIWSAGYDKIDGTEDDVCSWDRTVAAQQLQLQQQQQQFGGGMGTNTTDPNGMMQQNQGMMNDPSGMMQPGGMQQPGMTQPGGMQQPGMQQPGMTQPGGMQQPGMMQPGGMQQPGMMQPGGMQQPGMTQPGGMQQPPALPQ